MFQQQPIFADVCRWYSYAVKAGGNTPGVTIAAANGTGFGNITIDPNVYFCLTAFRAVTNYDALGGVFASADVAAILAQPPFVPNNFTVKIARGQNNTYSNQPLTQAEICSSGYISGKQLPLPVVYGPRFNFTFDFVDTTGLYLVDSDDDPIPLQIDMFMEGYTIPLNQWDTFLNYFPSLRNVFGSGQ